MGRAVVRRHAVVLTAVAGLAAGLTGCADATPGALDSDATDYAAASAVWQDPWVAPTAATVAGPALGSNALLTRVVGGRTTPYDVPAEAAAAAELAVASAAGWAPTSSECGAGVSIHLAGPGGALAALVATPSGAGSEVRVAVLTRHHLDDDWVVPEPVTETCIDGGPAHLVELPESSEPLRTADLPDTESVEWAADDLPATDDALRDEVNAELAAADLGEIPSLVLSTGENHRRAAATEATISAADLTAVARTLDGWTLTWTACGGGAPTRATYVRSFDHGPAVAHATLIGGKALLRFTLPIAEAPADTVVAGLPALDGSPCLGEVDELTVAGTPAVLPTELTPIA